MKYFELLFPLVWFALSRGISVVVLMLLLWSLMGVSLS